MCFASIYCPNISDSNFLSLCHACSHSPSLALEGARLPFITHICHHHYAHQCSLDSPGLLHLVDCPIYICLFLRVLPMSALLSFTFPLVPVLSVLCFMSVFH